MYGVIFGVPKGVFSISTSAFMAHPIFNPEQRKATKASPEKSDPKKEAKTTAQTKPAS